MAEKRPSKKQLKQRFEYFLLSNDNYALFKIRFKTEYNYAGKYYHIDIMNQFGNKNFDSQKYFMEKFETEKGIEKLTRFANENNVGLITY